MTIENLRAEASAVEDEAGGEITTRAALLVGAADMIEKMRDALMLARASMIFGKCWNNESEGGRTINAAIAMADQVE